MTEPASSGKLDPQQSIAKANELSTVRAQPLDPRAVFRLPGPLLGLVVVLGTFVLLLAWQGGMETLERFLSLGNIQGLLHHNTVRGVIALGALLVIVSGGIDLSVGSVAALVTVVTMQAFRLLEERTGSAAIASLGAVASGISVGGLCGLANGVMITRLRVTPFVVTLGMLSIARGLAYWLAGRTQITFHGAPPPWVKTLAKQRPDFGLFDLGVWSVVALALLAALVLRYTVFGRYCYAIGSNEATARLCGVDVGRIKVWIYTLAGLLAGWGGILLFAHGGSGDPGAGKQLELEVIAAVVIGGASLTGGQGNVFGTILGVLIFGILENGVTSLDVPIEIEYILIGLIIVVNTALSQWQRRRGE
jgi:ribose transport system permease protein